VLSAVVWLLALEFLGLLGFPIAFHLFRNLKDRGYAFAKPLAILLLSYALWVLGYSQVIPNGRSTVVLLIMLLGILSGWLYYRSWSSMISYFKTSWSSILAAEAVFLIVFALWGLLRALEPGINHTEQPMDFAFLNSIIRSSKFPPNDPWLSGSGISYYYFGYLMFAFVTMLTGVASSIAFNLALVSIGALAAAGAFSVVSNITSGAKGSVIRGAPYGAFAVFFLLVLGNLEGLLELLRSAGLDAPAFWQWVGIKGLDGPDASARLLPSDFWWWWRATRVIDTVVDGVSRDYTISEFPFFSFYLGDLHPHVMALPFAILSLGVSLNIFLTERPLGLSWVKERVWEPVLVGLILGALGFLNSWDLPSYAGLFLVALFLQAFAARRGLSKETWQDFVPSAALISFVAIYAYLPFYMELETQASGILPVRGVQTRPLHYLVFWGFFVFALLTFVPLAIRQVANRPVKRGVILASALLPLIPLILWSLIELIIRSNNLAMAFQQIGIQVWHLLPLLIPIGALAYLVVIVCREQEGEDSRGLAFCCLLLLGGYFLTIATELFFISDFFGNRMNTVFKLYYQAWVLIALGSACALYYTRSLLLSLHHGWANLRFAWVGLLSVMVAVALIYPLAAVVTRVEQRSKELTLDGLAFLNQHNPKEHEAIQWLNSNVKGPAIVLEAVGGDYSEYGRVSARTGLSALINWPGHQAQWRGSDEAFKGREAVVDDIYSSQDSERTKELLKAHGVDFIYVGHLERAKYQGEALAKFDSALEKVFDNNGVKIYRVSRRQ